VNESVISAEDSLFAPGEEAAAEPGSRRLEPEVVAVPMDDTQELVYGWMGLSPALLLESPPASDNLVVRIVRPGADPEAVLEEARQQLSASGSRRRRRGRGGSEGRQGSAEPITDQGTGPDARLDIPLVEITPLPLEPQESARSFELLTVDVPIDRSTGGGRGQRDAAVPGPIHRQATGSKAEDSEPAAEADATGEPRRRRRRSSASV